MKQINSFRNWIPFLLFTIIGVIAFVFSGHAEYTIAGFGATAPYACQRLQTDLVEYYGKNAPQFRTLGSVALIKWLLSPQNTSNFQRIDVETVPGKKRGVAFRVEQPMCFVLCRANPDCDDAQEVFEPADEEIVFDLSANPFHHCNGDGDPTVLQFTEEDLMKYCKDDDTTWIRNKITRYLFRFEEALDKALTTLLGTEIGKNAAGEVITKIPFFTAGNNVNPSLSVLNPEAMWYLNQTYMNMGLDGQFALLGGQIINKIAQFNKWATANSSGVDMSKVAAVNPYMFYNRNFETDYGNDMILLPPGAVQLVTWNKYKGEKRRQVTNLYTKSTVVLPTTGLEVDYKWYYDYKCEKWTFEAFLHAELAAVIKGGCGANMADVNGIIRINDCGVQPIIPACPEQPVA